MSFGLPNPFCWDSVGVAMGVKGQGMFQNLSSLTMKNYDPILYMHEKSQGPKLPAYRPSYADALSFLGCNYINISRNKEGHD